MISIFLSLLISTNLFAYEAKPMSMTSTEKARELEGIGINEQLGKHIDLDVMVTNEAGEKLPLSTYFDGHRPVLFSLVYYSCPGLCNFHLNGLTDGMKDMDWTVGNQYQAIALSFDPKEDAKLAEGKKDSYLKVYGRPEGAKGWHFLTADQATIDSLTKAVGFSYKWNDESKEWAHASAAVVMTPQGKISRYMHGVIFDGQTVKLSLMDASRGKVGNFVDKLIWYCTHYDPQVSKYTIYAFRLVQIAGILTVLLIGIFIGPRLWRSRREKFATVIKGTN